jgi:hypothetical protein
MKTSMLPSVLEIPQIRTNVIIQLYENINDIITQPDDNNYVMDIVITQPDDNAKGNHCVVILAETNRMLSPS